MMLAQRHGEDSQRGDMEAGGEALQSLRHEYGISFQGELPGRQGSSHQSIDLRYGLLCQKLHPRNTDDWADVKSTSLRFK